MHGQEEEISLRWEHVHFMHSNTEDTESVCIDVHTWVDEI